VANLLPQPTERSFLVISIKSMQHEIATTCLHKAVVCTSRTKPYADHKNESQNTPTAMNFILKAPNLWAERSVLR
jgi:hypothetical protein